MTMPTDMQPRKPRAVVRTGSRAGQDALAGRVTKLVTEKPIAEPMPTSVKAWEDTLSVGDLGLLYAIVLDFEAGGGSRVAVSLTGYAARLGSTPADVELRLGRLAGRGAIEVLERLRGALIVRPLSRLPTNDFARAAARLRPARTIRHRTRPARPAPTI